MQTLGRRVLDIDADCARLHGELTQSRSGHRAEPPRACPASASTPPRCCSSPPATTPSGSPPRPPSPTSAVSPRSTPRPARPSAIGSTGAATVKPTTPCGASCSPAWAPIRAPAPTSSGARRRTRQARDHARPQALRRPRGLPPPPTRSATIERRVWPPICPHATTAVLRTICRPAAHPSSATPPGLIRACPHTRVAHHWSASTVAKPTLDNT